jgi:iron(II)-dependent oxidoreductase
MAFPFARQPSLEIKAFEQQFTATWSRSDDVFGIIHKDDFLCKPIVWRHPFIFYVGHLPAFAWNQVCGRMLKRKSINPYFDDLFSRGIDPDVESGNCHSHPEVPNRWPSMLEVLKYRDRVREVILNSFDTVLDAGGHDNPASRRRVLRMVLEHEFMHQETLLYMIQELPPARKKRPRRLTDYKFQREATSQPIEIPSGNARLGARADGTAFAWDNEFPSSSVAVSGFRIDSLPVTNGRFLEFLDAGGYENPKLWTKEDWAWKRQFNIKHPNTWLKQKHVWQYRTMFDRLPLSDVLSWPVYVSLAEARAYACWKGQRLPTEAEFHRAAFCRFDGITTSFPWGEETASREYGNFDFVNWSPVPAGSLPLGESRWGVHELVGNGWEWTNTPFAPFSGFTPLEFYPEYSADFFDGKHFVLKGASWATGSDLLRPSFRNWYQAHYPYVFAKFRCVSDD